MSYMVMIRKDANIEDFSEKICEKMPSIEIVCKMKTLRVIQIKDLSHDDIMALRDMDEVISVSKEMSIGLADNDISA